MNEEIKNIIDATSMGKLEKKAVLKELLNLHIVVNCEDIAHNLYIDYDGECGACGGSVKK